MRPPKHILSVVVLFGVLVVAFGAYTITSGTMSHSSQAFAPGTNGITFPNPISQNVTVYGVMTSSVVSPTCALSNPPCAIANAPLYYITVGGWNYRLIFSNSTKPPLNHSHILVTGKYVTPSTYVASQWMPQMSFRGDIYVITYSYLSPIY
jgi:hypothetical protein